MATQALPARHLVAEARSMRGAFTTAQAVWDLQANAPCQRRVALSRWPVDLPRETNAHVCQQLIANLQTNVRRLSDRTPW